MIKPSALTFVVASIVGFGPADAQTLPVKEHVLKNGMKVLLVERHDEPTIACSWLAKVGSVNERPGITGLAHLFEHMMFKGTKTIGTRDGKRDIELNAAQDKIQAEIRKERAILREKQRRGEIADMQDPNVRTPRLQELLEEFDKLVKEQRSLIVKDEIWNIYNAAGATGINASTGNDRTNYIVVVPSNKLELWAWLESDRIMNPVFREFYSERSVILEERKQTLESRGGGLGRVNEHFNAMNWVAAPYTWEVIGWPSDISYVTREDANQFYATYYAPNNITAILVGDFKTNDAIALMEKYFERIPGNPRGVPEIYTEEPPRVGQKRMYAVTEAQPSIRINFNAVSAVHKDAPALTILASILGGGGGFGRGGGGGSSTGRLSKSLVLEQSAALSASANFSGMKYGGSFYLSASPTPGKTPEEMEPLLYAEIQKIVENGVTDAELQRAKISRENAMLMMQESNVGIRSALEAAEASGTYQDYLDNIPKFKAVTKEDVQRVAKDYIVKDRANVLVTTQAAPAAGGRGRSNPAREAN
ncbi:MAG: insulinase family protein [Holophagales bacterium]|jgi:predicted Zn-dependent peptidase|nr:insulinase family protein [Holophagales bacterium]